MIFSFFVVAFLDRLFSVLFQESESAEGVFMETLWAAIVLVGFSVTGYIIVLAVR